MERYESDNPPVPPPLRPLSFSRSFRRGRVSNSQQGTLYFGIIEGTNLVNWEAVKPRPKSRIASYLAGTSAGFDSPQNAAHAVSVAAVFLADDNANGSRDSSFTSAVIRSSTKFLEPWEATARAVWGEDFALPGIMGGMSVRVVVVDTAPGLGGGKMLGDVVVPLSRLPRGETIEQWYQLQPPPDSNLSFIKASVRLRLRFEPDGAEVTSSSATPPTPLAGDTASPGTLGAGSVAEIPSPSMYRFTMKSMGSSMGSLRPSISSAREMLSATQHLDVLAKESLPTGLVDYFLVAGPALDENGCLKLEDHTESGFGSGSHMQRAPPPVERSSTAVEWDAQRLTSLELQGAVLDCFPPTPREEVPFPAKVEWFCFPQGLRMKCCPKRPPAFLSSFVRFNGGVRSYGLCLNMYRRAFLASGKGGIDLSLSQTLPDDFVSMAELTAMGAVAEDEPRQRFWVPLCVCLLTHIPVVQSLVAWLRDFHAAFDAIEVARKGKAGGMQRSSLALEAAVFQLTMEVPLPIPGVCAMGVEAFTTVLHHSSPYRFALSGASDLPSCSFGLELLFRCLGPAGVVTLYAASLQESRILLHSTNMSILSPVAEGMFALMYPLQWPYAYVPVLPRILLEHVESPQPFVLGVHSSWLKDMSPDVYEDLVVVDCDRGMVHAPHIQPCPPSIRRRLLSAVRDAIHPGIMDMDSPGRFSDTLTGAPLPLGDLLTGDEGDTSELSAGAAAHMDWKQVETDVRFVFVEAMADMLFGYTECLFFVDPDRPIFNSSRFLQEYCREEFVPFLKSIVDTLAFKFLLENQNAPNLRLFSTLLEKEKRDAYRTKDFVANRRRNTGFNGTTVDFSRKPSVSAAGENVSLSRGIPTYIVRDALLSSDGFTLDAEIVHEEGWDESSSDEDGPVLGKEQAGGGGDASKSWSDFLNKSLREELPASAQVEVPEPEKYPVGEGSGQSTEGAGVLGESCAEDSGTASTENAMVNGEGEAFPAREAEATLPSHRHSRSKVMSSFTHMNLHLLRTRSSFDERLVEPPSQRGSSIIASGRRRSLSLDGGPSDSQLPVPERNEGQGDASSSSASIPPVKWRLPTSLRLHPQVWPTPEQLSLTDIGNLLGSDLSLILRSETSVYESSRSSVASQRSAFLRNLVMNSAQLVPEGLSTVAGEDAGYLHRCLEAAFTSDRVPENELHLAEQSLGKDIKLRQQFLEVLRQPGRRGTGSKGPVLLQGLSFETLARFSYTLLCHCVDSSDYDTAHSLLQLTGGYFQVHESNDPVTNAMGGEDEHFFSEFLSSRIRRHPIFADERFWLHMVNQNIESSKLKADARIASSATSVTGKRMSGTVSPALGPTDSPNDVAETLLTISEDESSAASDDGSEDGDDASRRRGSATAGSNAAEELVLQELKALLYEMVGIGIGCNSALEFVRAAGQAYGLPADRVRRLQDRAQMIWENSTGWGEESGFAAPESFSALTPQQGGGLGLHQPQSPSGQSVGASSAPGSDLGRGPGSWISKLERPPGISPPRKVQPQTFGGKKVSFHTALRNIPVAPQSLTRHSSSLMSSGDNPSLRPSVDLWQGGDPQGPITCISACPKRAVAGTTDCCVAVFDLTTASLSALLPGHTGAITSVQCIGDIVISSSLDSSLRVWELSRTAALAPPVRAPRKASIFSRLQGPSTPAIDPPRTLLGHKGAVLCCSLLENNLQGEVDHDAPLHVMSGSADGQVRMWDAMGGMCRVIFKGHEGPVECIDSTLQGFLVASGSSDGTVRLWDVNQETGCKALRKFVGHDAGVNAVRFCSTAVAVSASNDRTLRIWDRRVKGCVNVLTGHVGPVTCIEVSLASKSAIASGSADTTVQLWDMRSTSRGPMMNLGSHSDRVSCLYRLPRSIISVGEDASMTEWEWTPKTSSPPSSPGKQQPPRPMGLFREHACGISCVSGNSQVVVTGSWDGSARMWNLRR